jgi:hypothetical protein
VPEDSDVLGVIAIGRPARCQVRQLGLQHFDDGAPPDRRPSPGRHEAWRGQFRFGLAVPMRDEPTGDHVERLHGTRADAIE